MKKFIKSSTSNTRKLHQMIDFLSEEGVDEHTMLSFLIDEMTSDEGIEKMKKLADECDVDLEEFWERFN